MGKAIFGMSSEAFKSQFNIHSKPSLSYLASEEKQRIFQSKIKEVQIQFAALQSVYTFKTPVPFNPDHKSGLDGF